MKIIICGAGQVGWQIAKHLSSENNDVSLIDNNPQLVQRATDTLDVAGVVGFASYPDVLERAGAREADMVIAATHSDEVNMVVCQVAHSVFAVPRKIARLRAKSYLDAIYSDLYRRDHMPIDVVISPEYEVAESAIRRLAVPSAFDTEDFLDHKVQMIGLLLADDCPVINTPLRQLSELFSTLSATVVGIKRQGNLYVPNSTDQLLPGDQVYIFTPKEDLNRTLEVFGKEQRDNERYVIVGGGNVGLAVAKRFEEMDRNMRVRIIERSRAVAEHDADTLDSTIVLHGDGMDGELLEEARVGSAEALLAVTDDDRTNLLVSTKAKLMGCQMVMALINDPENYSLISKLGVDAYVNPRATTVSTILRHIRHGRIRAIYSVGDAEAEIIEAQVLSTSPISGKTIRNIDFPEGTMVGSIMRGDKLIRPRADIKIEERDIVVVFALTEAVPEVERLFQVSIDLL